MELWSKHLNLIMITRMMLLLWMHSKNRKDVCVSSTCMHVRLKNIVINVNTNVCLKNCACMIVSHKIIACLRLHMYIHYCFFIHK